MAAQLLPLPVSQSLTARRGGGGGEVVAGDLDSLLTLALVVRTKTSVM